MLVQKTQEQHILFASKYLFIFLKKGGKGEIDNNDKERKESSQEGNMCQQRKEKKKGRVPCVFFFHLMNYLSEKD